MLGIIKWFSPNLENNRFILYPYFVANKIQISKTTWLLLSMKGGFMMEERGMIEVKVISNKRTKEISVSYILFCNIL